MAKSKKDNGLVNVKLVRAGDVLSITIDLSKDFGPSGSGKTTRVASTLGNIAVPGNPEIKLGINCYKMGREGNVA